MNLPGIPSKARACVMNVHKIGIGMWYKHLLIAAPGMIRREATFRIQPVAKHSYLAGCTVHTDAVCKPLVSCDGHNAGVYIHISSS